MMRLIVLLLVILALVGGAFWLAGRDASKPLARVEKVVPADALPR
jgi:hypothetical protein